MNLLSIHREAQMMGHSDIRKFGILLGIMIAAIFGFFWPIVLDYDPSKIAMFVGFIIAVIAWPFPKAMAWIYSVWMLLAQTLRVINSNIILGLIYFGVLTPVAIFRRILKSYPLAIGFEKDTSSYRVPSTQGKNDMEKLY